MPLRFKRRALAAATLAATGACAPYRADPGLAADPARVSPRMALRVTRADGSRVELVEARLLRDSLVGRSGTPGRRVAVARADIRAVERRRFSAERTLLAYWVYAGVVALVYLGTEIF
jgi:hypothetical protein